MTTRNNYLRVVPDPQPPAIRRRVAMVPMSNNAVSLDGTLAQIQTSIAQIGERRQIVSVSSPISSPTGEPGMVQVTVQLLPNRQPAPPPKPAFWNRRRVTIAAIVAATVMTVVAWAMYLIAVWVMAHLAAIALIAAGVVGLALLGGPRVCRTIVSVTHFH